MADFIDRDELMRKHTKSPNHDNSHNTVEELKCLLDLIDKAPTVDAVQVVRCRDCKYRDEEITIPAPDESPYESFTFASCPCKSFNLGDDFFCGKGERKDGEYGGEAD